MLKSLVSLKKTQNTKNKVSISVQTKRIKIPTKASQQYHNHSDMSNIYSRPELKNNLRVEKNQQRAALCADARRKRVGEFSFHKGSSPQVGL